MSMDCIADPGYESDTGERDIPTCAHFEANEPVERKIGYVVGGTKKAPNRLGRAICRIMAAQPGWSHGAIARIFHVSPASVGRAIDNIHYSGPRDNIEEDYDRVDGEFLKRYPPQHRNPGAIPREIISLDGSDNEYDDKELDSETGPSFNGRPQRSAESECRSRIEKVADGEQDNVLKMLQSSVTPQKRLHEDSAVSVTPRTPGNLKAGSPAKRHRYGDGASNGHSQGSTPSFSSSPQRSQNFPGSVQVKVIPPRRLRLPRPQLSANTQTVAAHRELELFLKTWTSVDFVPHCELLIAQGFMVARLHTLATWSKAEIEQAVHRLLTGKRGMTAMASIRFEFAAQKLTSTPPARAPLARSILPPPSSNATNSGTTLLMFLENVMGFNLSSHHALIEEQGFDIATLSTMASWNDAQLEDALNRTLLVPTTEAARAVSKLPPGKPGLKALEVLALKFYIKRAASEK
ncbi:hypothetical protein DFH06DRAFT_1473251 [Mycena polygramma]|nr:hypothetical protein DFH06DRAFT_1473251 [Mycena polygramma]